MPKKLFLGILVGVLGLGIYLFGIQTAVAFSFNKIYSSETIPKVEDLKIKKRFYNKIKLQWGKIEKAKYYQIKILKNKYKSINLSL